MMPISILPATSQIVRLSALNLTRRADMQGRGVQIFGSKLTLAKDCQKEWPSERGNQVVAEMVRNRGLN
jgi:hypothetical protein